ncbi:MAG: cob(I)yrinic acid a,c-diamide adenosyltransferase [Synergistaceae bacterium]
MKLGQFQIYTGNGKGKSTAMFGLCFRALGRGFKIKIFQMRKNQECGEHISAKKIGLDIIQCPVGRHGEICAQPCPLYLEAMEALKNENLDILVIDEMMEALRCGCITKEQALAMIDARPEETELIMTGRNVPEEILEKANLVTSMEPIKHYFKKGIPAREGIEY